MWFVWCNRRIVIDAILGCRSSGWARFHPCLSTSIAPILGVSSDSHVYSLRRERWDGAMRANAAAGEIVSSQSACVFVPRSRCRVRKRGAQFGSSQAPSVMAYGWGFNCQTSKGYASAFSRLGSARALRSFRPHLEQRAQGKPDARCTRGLVCNVHKEVRTRAYRSSGGIPAFPARWVTAYFELSPVNGCFATVAARE